MVLNSAKYNEYISVGVLLSTNIYSLNTRLDIHFIRFCKSLSTNVSIWWIPEHNDL